MKTTKVIIHNRLDELEISVKGDVSLRERGKIVKKIFDVFSEPRDILKGVDLKDVFVVVFTRKVENLKEGEK